MLGEEIVANLKPIVFNAENVAIACSRPYFLRITGINPLTIFLVTTSLTNGNDAGNALLKMAFPIVVFWPR